MITEEAAADWGSLIDQLRPIGEEMYGKLTSEDPQQRAEVDQMMMAVLVHGFLDLLGSNPDQPMLMPGYGIPMNYAAPNGDTIYCHTLIRGDGVYRISGDRNSVPVVNFGFGEVFYQLIGKLTPRVDYDIDSLSVDDDGRYSVVVSAERPRGYDGDWWQMPTNTTYLGVRQVMLDWEKEKDATIAIERVDVPVNIPRRPAADLRTQLALLPTWVRNGTGSWLDYVARIIAKPVNRLEAMASYKGGGGLPGQIILDGAYRFEPDQALIMEMDAPRAKYWSVILCDDLFATVDWMNHQSSLNLAQAELDPDGKMRLVVALTDPGVPNWLDPAGRVHGLVQARWLKPQIQPSVTMQPVPLADVREHVHSSTRFVTPEERDDALRRRKRAFQARKWW